MISCHPIVKDLMTLKESSNQCKMQLKSISCHPIVKESLNVSNLLLPDTTTNLQKVDELVVHLHDKCAAHAAHVENHSDGFVYFFVQTNLNTSVQIESDQCTNLNLFIFFNWLLVHLHLHHIHYESSLHL